ncbi:MAG: hypothetical protein PHQ59_03700 [Candidatus Daviesbacteria bacterium]|nr:hypothetical protein [Candidatus Daviesbacteria bacterium]
MTSLNDDDKKHLDVESPEEQDAESALGSEVKSGSEDVNDVDKIAESMGMYEEDLESPDAGPENPAEVDVAKEIEKHNEG